MVTDDIAAGNMIAELDTVIVELVKDFWCDYSVSFDLMHECCLESATEWDIYTKSLTPNLPERLADFVTEEITLSQFDAYWLKLRQALSEPQKTALIDYYQYAILQTFGQNIALTNLQ